MYAHPVPASYSAALRDRAATALRARGDEVDVLDLYGEGFDPHLDADEWSPDTPGGEDRPDLNPYIARLRRADHLVAGSIGCGWRVSPSRRCRTATGPAPACTTCGRSP